MLARKLVSFCEGPVATECHNTLRPQLAVGRRVENAEKRGVEVWEPIACSKGRLK